MNSRPNDERGFVLVTVLLLLVLLSAVAFTLNSRSGLQARIASNQAGNVQTYLGQVSAAEQAFWRLGQMPTWRTTGESYTYQGVSYTRSVKDSSVTGCADCVTVSVTVPGGSKAIGSSFRYYMDTPPPFVTKKPYKVIADSAGNVYFADADSHSIWKLDNAGAVTRVAGTGTSGFGGDGGPAVLAQLNGPEGLCLDGSGNLYVADTQNHRVRKINVLTGTMTTVAGSGNAGDSGDGGQALAALINGPKDVAVDNQGNIFVADTGNNRIRKVSASTGIITTFAGTGIAGYAGDEGPAASARLKWPSDVAIDTSGNVFIVDTLNHLIRKVDTSGTIHRIAGMAGTPGYTGDGGSALSARLNFPRGVSLDQAGNIYIADTDNNRIRRVTPSGSISTYAGDGNAGDDDDFSWQASFDHPRGVFVTNSGQVYVADTMNCTIRTVIYGGYWVSTLAITPGLGLSGPSKVAAYYSDSAQRLYLYIADTENHRIRRFDTSANTLRTVAGTGTAGYSGDGHDATEARLDRPQGVAVDSDGNIYIADTGNCVIRRVDASTGRIRLLAGVAQSCGYADAPTTTALFNHPSAVFKSGSGDVYIADTDNHAVRRFREGGNVSTIAGTGTPGYSGDGGPAVSATLRSPSGVYRDASNSVYIADTQNRCIRRIDAASGSISTVPGTESLNRPSDVVSDGSGGLIVADSANNAVYAISNGSLKTLAGTPTSQGFNGDNRPAVTAQVNRPYGIALAGNRAAGRIYIGDTGNNRVRVLFLRKVKELY